MTITTKYDIGETVWFMEDNKACSATIKSCELDVGSNNIHTVYTVTHPSHKCVKYAEVHLFPTKEALLASL